VQLAVVAKLARDVKAFRIFERLPGGEVGPDALAERVELPLEGLRLLVVQLLLDDRPEGGGALSFGESPDTAGSLLCWSKLVRRKGRQHPDQLLPEGLDGVVVILV